MKPDNRHAALARRYALLPLLAGALLLTGCDYFGYTLIKDITASPANFEGKEVRIRGQVQNAVQLLGLRTFTLRDATGEIVVVTGGSLPADGTSAAVKGIVKSAIIVEGRSLGLRVEENERLR